VDWGNLGAECWRGEHFMCRGHIHFVKKFLMLGGGHKRTKNYESKWRSGAQSLVMIMLETMMKLSQL